MRQHVEIDGRTISYCAGGQYPAIPTARTRTVIFLHGFPLNADMWRPQLTSALSGWRLLAPDFRGCGLDPGTLDIPSPAASLDDYADDVLLLMRGLGIDEAVIVGLSMGGYVAFALMRKAPDRVAGLVLADTRAGEDTESGRAGRLAMLERLGRDGLSAVADDIIPKFLGARTLRNQPQLTGLVRRLILESSVDAVRGGVYRMLSRPDSAPGLSDITCPTALVVGSDDTITPPAESRAMQQRIDGSRLHVIERAGHLSNLEQAGAFNSVLAGFLAMHF